MGCEAIAKAKIGNEVGRGNNFCVKLFTHAQDPGSGIKHIAGIRDISFNNAYFSSHHFSTMETRFEGRD
jgi:hypothetical protein